MKNTLIKFLSFFIVLFSLTGCSTENRLRRQNETTPIELTMWVHQLFSPEGEVYQRRISEFNTANKGKIHVTLIGIPRPGYEIQVNAAASSGKLPDIIAVDGPDMAKYVELGAIIPMDLYIDKDFLSDFLPSIIEQGTYKDKLYHLGPYESSVVLYYNKDLLQQARIQAPTTIEEAWTWDQLLENAKKLSRLKVYGLNLYDDYYETEWFTYAFLPFVWSNGGEIISPDGSTVEGYLNGAQTVEALEFIGEIFQSGVANTSLKNIDFQTKKAAMVLDGPWLGAELKENYPDLRWGMMPYPVSPNTRQQVTPSGSWGFSITSNSKNPKEAFEVIKWMTNKDSTESLYKAIQMPPARKSVFEEITEFNELPNKIIADQLFTTARPRPKTPAYPILSQSFADALKEVASGVDAKEALDYAAIKVETELKKYK